MTSTNRPTNTLPDANITPTSPPTNRPTSTETDKEKRKRQTAEKKKKEKEQMRAELRAEMEAEMEAMRAEIAELKKKPERKGREPKPLTYWEGQVETEGGWRFETAETAGEYAKSLKAKDAVDFMINWGQSFVERKEKITGRIINQSTDRTKNGENGCEVLVPKIAGGWKHGAEGCGRNFNALRGGRRICRQHEKTADDHMAKYANWKEEFGTHNGWVGEVPQARIKDKTLHHIRNDYVKQTRGKKD